MQMSWPPCAAGMREIPDRKTGVSRPGAVRLFLLGTSNGQTIEMMERVSPSGNHATMRW